MMPVRSSCSNRSNSSVTSHAIKKRPQTAPLSRVGGGYWSLTARWDDFGYHEDRTPPHGYAATREAAMAAFAKKPAKRMSSVVA